MSPESLRSSNLVVAVQLLQERTLRPKKAFALGLPYKGNLTFDGYEQNVYHFSSQIIETDSPSFVIDKEWLGKPKLPRKVST